MGGMKEVINELTPSLLQDSKYTSESESEVAQSCPTLFNPMDCSPPGSSVHGIFQARLLEWIAISFSRRSSQSRDGTHVSCIAGGFFTLSYLGIDSYKWINHTCCMGLWWDFEWSSNDDGDDVDGCHLWSISVRYKAECFMFYHLILTTIMLKSIDLHFIQDETEVQRS